MGDDGSHANCLYNKIDGHVPTLVGNWAEERVLAERTGYHRLKTWCSSMTDESTSVYPRHVGQDGKHGLASLPRTLEHDEQHLSAEWLSTNSVVYQPQPRVGDLMQYRNTDQVGPREALELARMMETAKQMQPRPEAMPHELQTIYREQYTAHDTSGITLGRSRMKNQDGGPVQRDADFLAETKTLSRDFADRHVAQRDRLQNSQRTVQPPADLPITIYSERLAKGEYNGTMYGTKAIGAQPFGKHTNFTKPVGDWSKDPSDE